MKTITKAILFAGVAILVIIAIPFGKFIYELAVWSNEDRKQMDAAKIYMDFFDG